MKKNFCVAAISIADCRVERRSEYRRQFSLLEKKPRRDVGFTLIELMIVVVIIAILATIALPSYQNYVKRSRAKAASADLVALSLNFENAFQRTLSYPVSTAATTADTKTLMPGWVPSQGEFFVYSVTSTATTYALTATGSGQMSNCNLTLNNSNDRTASGAPCGGVSSW